jgi:hypothetical protein
MNSSSDLSINNHSSPASTRLPAQQQEILPTASTDIPDEQLAILQSQNDEHAKKVPELDKTLFESGRQILELQGNRSYAKLL